MSTSSTLVAVKSALVTQLGTALEGMADDGGDVPAFYSWPGPNAERECLFLGRPLFSIDATLSSVSVASDIPTMKAGRKQRQESYDIPGTVWSYRGDLTPEDAEEAETRVDELVNVVDDLLADTPNLGLSAIQHARLTERVYEIRPYDNGFVVAVFFTIHVEARLT